MGRRIRSLSKTKPIREPADRRLWTNVHDTEFQTYKDFLASKAAQDTSGPSPAVLFARDFAKAAIPVFLLFNVPRVLKWTFRRNGKAKKDNAQAAREQMAQQQQQAMRQQLLQQQLAAARAQAAAAKPAAAAAPKPADKPATAGASAAAQAAEDKARLVERLRQLKQAKLEQERKKAAQASAPSSAPKGLGAALQKPVVAAADPATAATASAAVAAGAPKGLGAGLGAPKGLGAGLGAPKGLGAGLEGPKGLGAGLGAPKGLGGGLGAPKGMGAGLLPKPKRPEAAEEEAATSSPKAEPKGLGGLALPSKPKGMGAGLGGGLPVRSAAGAEQAPPSSEAAAAPAGLAAALPSRATAAAEPGDAPEPQPAAAAAEEQGEQEHGADAAGDNGEGDAAPPTPQQQEGPLASSAAVPASPEEDAVSPEQDDVLAPTTPTPEPTAAVTSREATPTPSTPDKEGGGDVAEAAGSAAGKASHAEEAVQAVASSGAGHATEEAVPQPEAQAQAKWEFQGATPEAVPLPDGSGVLVVRRMAANNSCLFNAVDFVVYGQRAGGQGGVHAADEGGMQLRLVVANEVDDFPDRYSEAFLGLPNDRYVDWIQQPSSWGGGIELAVLASHFKTELAAWNIESSACHVFGEESGYKKQGMVIYDGKHYDALAVAKSLEASAIHDETTFNPASPRFRMVAAAAQKLVELQSLRKKGLPIA